jgi:hypothetical protein
MENVFVFVPRHALDAERNLAQFVESCRTELTIFQPGFCWSDITWRTPGVGFYNIDQGKASRDPSLVLREPFIDFAKAYFRYRQTHNPNQHHAEMRALKCVERALLQMTGAASPCSIDESVLDMAAQLAREHFKQPYPAGREIASLAKFLTDHQLTARPLDWKNPIKRPSDTTRTGSEAKKLREARLPAQEALDALAEIFAEGPTDHSEIFVTSTVALLLCAPSRISEIIELPVDCEVEERKRDGSVAYGWRFRPKKLGAPMIKWIPDVMVDIAKQAIARVRQITQPARDLALWLEDGGALPVSIASLFDGSADIEREYAAALAGEPLVAALPATRRGQAETVLKDDLLRSLRANIYEKYPHFPYIDDRENIKWSELLYCFNRNQLHSSRGTLPLGIWRPNNGSLNDRMGCKSDGTLGIFYRRNIAGRNGEALRVRSHDFRRLLGTIASRGGLSAPEIARWRGSKDVRQNRAYDYRSEYELAAMIRANDPALIRGSSELEIAEKIKVALPLTTEEFNTLEKTTAHITEVGFCLHDFVMAPCQRFRDCINCTEQVCVKGDRRLSGLREQLVLVEHQLEAAKDGAAEGLYGADPWTHIQTQTRDRLVGLIEIMEDPNVPDGSVIRLANSHEFSSARRALRQRGFLPSPPPALGQSNAAIGRAVDG